MTFAEWLPWLLFGLLAGALVDRWERRRVMWTVDAFRLVVVGGFAVAVLAGWASIPLLMATGFLLGTGQTLVDTASQALVPSLVSRDPGRLARANGRLAGTRMVAEELVGPPAGGLLFSLAAWVPFAADAVSFGAGSALVAAIGGRPVAAAAPSPAAGRRTSLRAEIAEGMRWLFAHRVLWAMALLVAGFNLVGAARVAVTVLFAQERLGPGQRRVRAAAGRRGGRRDPGERGRVLARPTPGPGPGDGRRVDPVGPGHLRGRAGP